VSGFALFEAKRIMSRKPATRLAVKLWLALLASATAIITPAAADPLTLQGSTTLNSQLLAPYQRDIESLSQQTLVIVPNKSSTGLQALFEGRADLGMISGPLELEKDALRKTNPSAPLDRLQAFEVSRTQMAFSIHPSNPVRFLSTADLRRILLGEVRNWSEVGGRDTTIRLIMVREGGGVQASVESQILGGKKVVAPDPIRVQIGSQVVKVSQQEPGALGLAQRGVLTRAKAAEMKIDKPIEQTLSLVSLGEPTPAMRRVIDATRQIAAKVLD
jgi:ABC-type phosphate transport system substrate-binding protein